MSIMPVDTRVQNSAMAFAAQIIWGLHEAAAVIFGQLRGSRKGVLAWRPPLSSGPKPAPLPPLSLCS